MILHHFTPQTHLPGILHSGFLSTTDSNLSMTSPDASVVWLTDLEDVEKGSHGLGGSPVDKTTVRISVDVHGIPWLSWRPMQDMDPWWRETIIATGGGMEAAKHWYVFPAPIKRHRWTDIRVDGRFLTDWNLVAGAGA